MQKFLKDQIHRVWLMILPAVLDRNDYRKLETNLEQFARETSTQIVVVTSQRFGRKRSGRLCIPAGRKMGSWPAEDNNGLVILVKPKTDNENGQVFIATGYGLEGVLPDAVVNSTIVRE